MNTDIIANSTSDNKPFSILDHLTKLSIVKETASEYHCICPVCGDDNLKIQKTGSKAGRYACYSTGCIKEEIREVISPLSEKQGKYTTDRTSTKKASRQKDPTPAPTPEGSIELAKLPAPATDIPQRVDKGKTRETKYWYSETQYVLRSESLDASKEKGYSKKFFPYHIDAEGHKITGKGNVVWLPYRIQEVEQHGKGKWLLVVEGERCVEYCRWVGLISSTLQGSDWQEDPLYKAVVEWH